MKRRMSAADKERMELAKILAGDLMNELRGDVVAGAVTDPALVRLANRGLVDGVLLSAGASRLIAMLAEDLAPDIGDCIN